MEIDSAKDIMAGNFDKKLFVEKYNNGISCEDMDFGYKTADILTEITIAEIVKNQSNDDKITEIVSNYGLAILQLNPSQYAYALDKFKTKLADNMPDFSILTPDGYQLKTDVRVKIAETLSVLDGFTEYKKEITVHIISDTDRFKEKMLDKNSNIKRNINIKL